MVRLWEPKRENEPFKWSSLTLAGPVTNAELDDMAAKGVERVLVTPWENKKQGSVGMEGMDQLERYAKELNLI